MTRHRWDSLAASRTWPSGSWSASVIFNWARPPLKRANAKFACVTPARAIAGSEPSFQSVEHLPQTAFDDGGLLPPNAVDDASMILVRKLATTRPLYSAKLSLPRAY